MDSFASFIHQQREVDVLRDFDKDLALDAGIAPARVKDWEVLHKVYFGPTTSPQKQRLAYEAACRGKISLDTLAMIERRLKPITSRRTRDKLRLAALAIAGRYKHVADKLKTLIPKAAPKPAEDRITFSPSRSGKRRMTVTCDERILADLEHYLRQKHERGVQMAKHMLTRFIDLIRGKHSGGGVPSAAPRPLLLIPLDAWVSIHRGTGNDVTLGLTDGTTISGADFLTKFTATTDNHLEAALFHPQEGPVNLYRTERFANQKQRDLARATTPICPVPGCRHAADNCEIHHIQAWKHGGETNLENLAPLCSYHNGTNDDDPETTRRGRITTVDGQPVWQSPRGYLVPNSLHPYGAMATLFEATVEKQGAKA
ncbi:HNH endonuclease [Corynebacterium sp. TA-R-1]|uniref:HNH endonuclease n=1 Tax=Corynebacterium stercoris TaxID=2943490 RepID=A0ABT1FYX9_9CORY|nr:HNH endonuclease signature motif containing protein [Corynebacterium stercoris]MCP1386970.1 HNH endonuclease [Corynebacterium stercoris]